MVRSPGLLRALTVLAAGALVLAACGQPPAGSQSGAPQGSGSGGAKGGTVYILTQAEQWNRIDPQRAYTGEDLAFFGATIYRSLVSYTPGESDATKANQLIPDLATDTGTPNADATQWKFTLRDGATWQDGSPVTCEDVKYGVSRTFANDVISEGPTYAIAYLDIPAEDDPKSTFLSKYHGPYDKGGQDLYDKAVTCDGNTITFNLKQPVPDFNYTTTLGFSPVPQKADTGEKYDSADVVSSGPYKVDSYTTGNGGKFVLVRNENWDQASDPIRTALPDKWEVDFGIDPKIMDQRLMASNGPDATALMYGNVQPENLATIFQDPQTVNPQYQGRAWSAFDPYSIYYFINVQKVKNEKVRQAMAVALDRQALLLNAGGQFAGVLADGVIKPNIGQDYAETGWATDLFGEAIPPEGNPELAKKLIQESGASAADLSIGFNYATSPVNEQAAAIVKSSLEKAGFKVTPKPLEPGSYYSVVFDPEKAAETGTGGWGPDWPNASTVIPPLFTQEGGWDLSQVDDPAFNQKVKDAQTELDRATQAKMWQDLNKEAMQHAWVIPTRFNTAQVIAGNKLGGVDYQWPPYGSWDYSQIYVKQ
ncbi:MAG TPA: ABC transporter substrate-binding protein [Candidatus Limnocylindria bacterium]|nr:ABC transporter substrate-binding protein [Candidatus Limnocylindria bacterium]